MNRERSERKQERENFAFSVAKLQAKPNAVDFFWSCEGLWRDIYRIYTHDTVHIILAFVEDNNERWINELLLKMIIIKLMTMMMTLADPGGGAPGARPPPNGRGPMIFYAQNANFSHFFRRSLRSRFILSLILIEI